ncbi:HypC/HybG/HupF family hydrogenase formation chaperone [Thermodesulfobacterium sp. TA1]|uniref:HypC/HybG/HupF family hydrogenase formation chaperone n=1 Tax=Thermodesulfobacterium sp. TA1 TaxID=2234087 RepID=UPI001231D3B8|nr:HypC/HybG/HupF family hydrogenase formation chaperone [Thermodesulfobacterium sp. TA1]QER41512.1 HypC/HybG/HupF family hydrogenase formation chaperone [Thermodesulfobacterium sp. TA1]
MCLAYPYRIVEVKDEWTAIAEVQGVKTEVALHLLPEKVKEGDWVLVHVGFAIKRLSEEEAQESLRYWDEILRLTQPNVE